MDSFSAEKVLYQILGIYATNKTFGEKVALPCFYRQTERKFAKL